MEKSDLNVANEIIFELQDRIDEAIQIIDLTLSIGVKDYKGQLEVIKNILKGSDKE